MHNPEKKPPYENGDSRSAPIPEFSWPALRMLLRAYDYAQEVACDRWEFAIEIAKLSTHLDYTDLRWLVKQRFATHAVETTKPGDSQRSFIEQAALMFSEKSCFVLADLGVGVARRLNVEPRIPDLSQPHWCGDRHELFVGEHLVKRFRLPSHNQERVLTVFQEEGWPARIDDPLPPHPEIDPKHRLRDTIKGLNRNQRCPILHFLGDGTGEAILWELAGDLRSREASASSNGNGI